MNLRKFAALFLFLNISFFLTAMEIQNQGDFFQLNMKGEVQEKAFIFAFPSESASVEIISSLADEYDSEGNIIRTTDTIIPDFITYNQSFIMRDLHGHSFIIHPTLEMNDRSYQLQDLRFRIIPEDEIAAPNQISSVFLPLYEAVVSNFETSYLRDLATTPPRMLILTQPTLANFFHEFMDWKKQLGIDVDLYTTIHAGNTNNQIKQFIQNRYDNEATRPDYVLLIGDVNDTFAFPSFYFGSANNVTDQPYVLLDGNDYFPDALIGRFSIDTTLELSTVINKQFRYARDPYLDYDGWLESAVLIAGNYSSSPPTPTSPTEVTMWLAEKMESYGFQNITEIYYPPTYPGTNQITSAINSGASFVTYRGWADANGWHYPHYHTEHIAGLNNGAMLPVMTSIVCNTGDFANSVDPCFGEAMLRAGTPSSPKGMVGFVGPSDLHTSTKYNNAIFSGFYAGLLDENIFNLDLALLRGKIQLYQSFPLETDTGDWAEFYFHVYNVLGDPSLQMWTKIPQTFAADLPDEITIATNHLHVPLTNALNGAKVTAVQSNTLLDVSTVQNGTATLYFDELDNEELVITVSKPNFVPLMHSIDVITSNVDIGISEINAESLLYAGQTNTINITLHNYGSENSDSIIGHFSSSNPMITFAQDAVDFGTINSGTSVSEGVAVFIDAACPNHEIIEVALELSPVNQTRKFELMVGSIHFDIVNFEVINNNGFMQPGMESTIEVTIQNSSIIDALNSEVLAVSLSDAANVISNSISIGNVAVAQTETFTFAVFVEEDVYIGRPVSFHLDFVANNGNQYSAVFTMEAGEVTNTAPTGPDSFGYFAYDSFDIGYSEAPTYFWHEIDPLEGGNGEVLLLEDDTSVTIPLPFSFQYYGQECNEITICDNGWLAFEPTWMANFRNWPIPAPLGPAGMVAPYWDDLKGKNVGGQYELMRISYYHDTSNNYFVIEWNETYNWYDNNLLEKFQVVLYDPAYHAADDGSGVIQFNYHTIHNPNATNNYATVGIENFERNDGVQYTFASLYPPSATPLQAGLSIKFTTNPPDTYTSADETMIPALQAKLYQNYPNPFNPNTTISFEIPVSGNVTLKMYDIKGRLVKTLLHDRIESGYHSIVWNGDDNQGNSVASGIYFYKLTVPNEAALMKKSVLIK